MDYQPEADHGGVVEPDDITPVQAKRPLTIGLFFGCLEAFAEVLGVRIREAHNRCEALEARIAALEARPISTVKWSVWKNDGTIHTAGSLVTWNGSLWLAQRDTSVRPGRNDDYRLIVKRGSVKDDDDDEIRRR